MRDLWCCVGDRDGNVRGPEAGAGGVAWGHPGCIATEGPRALHAVRQRREGGHHEEGHAEPPGGAVVDSRPARGGVRLARPWHEWLPDAAGVHQWLRSVSPWANMYMEKCVIFFNCLLLLRPFHYLRSAHQVFNLHVLVLLLSLLVSPEVVSFLVTSLHLSFGLPIFRCPPTSIFSSLHLLSSSVFLSTCPNHLSLASLIFSLIFATPPLALISSFLLFIPIIGLYRDVWIAAIAWSRTSLAAQMAAICVCFQRLRVRHNANYIPYAQIRFNL